MRSLALLAASAVLLAACTHNKTTVNVETAPAAPTQSATPAPAGSPDAMMKTEEATGKETKVALKGTNFSFGQDQIKVKKGEKLVLAVTNAEGFHDLKIDELNVNTGMIPAGQTKEVTVPTDKPGTYEYYCSVGNHRAQGMKGTLIIE